MLWALVARLTGLACTAILAAQAQASTGELFGYGSRASALGNTMLGGVSDGFGTFYNPAANSSLPGLNISVATVFAHPNFTSITNVVIENGVNSPLNLNTADTVGNVDTDYLNVLEEEVALTLNLGPKVADLAIGVTALMPIERIAYLDTGDPYLPEYFNYRSRVQRPQIYASLSATPLKNLHVGAGLAFSNNLSASTNMFLTSSTTNASRQRFAATIKAGAAPYFSVYTDPKPFQAGLTARLPNVYKTTIDTTAKLQLMGPGIYNDLAFSSDVSVFYDPLEIDAGLAWQATPAFWMSAELDWFQYSAYQVPALSIQNPQFTFNLHSSVPTAPPMQNILVPKVGFEYAFPKVTARLGYFYRPSPVTDNSGNGNFVDPAKHVATIGLGLDLKKLGVTEKQIFLDLHGQFHYLVSQHITKSPNNELGNATNGTATEYKIGAPGYDIGGYIYGGGLSLSMNF